MKFPFVKMHGAGNDYVFLDGFESEIPDNLSDISQAVSHRHHGIGSDGLVVLEPATTDDAEVRMTMWNADGSEGLMCGNAIRCVALWLNLTRSASEFCRIQTATRSVTVQTLTINRAARKGMFSADLGAPIFQDSVLFHSKQHQIGGLTLHCVSIGNPHAVAIVDTMDDALVRTVGREIETAEQFPEGTNVEWVRRTSPQTLEVRVWERGSGETLACGSGACAAGVVAVKLGLCCRESPTRVQLPGGELTVYWRPDDRVVLSGPAEVSFEGELQLAGHNPRR